MKNINYSLSENDLTVFLPILIVIISFTIFWFVSRSPLIQKSLYNKYPFEEASVKHILFKRCFGFLCLGTIPFVLCLFFLPAFSLSSVGIDFNPETILFSLKWITILTFLLIPFIITKARRPKNLKKYPEIRRKIWTRRIVILNAAGWFIYVLAYEVLFRGILLFPLVNSMGVWPAVAINVAIYMAVNIPKGLDDTIWNTLLGVVFCVLTIQSGTIWIAFFVHLSIAWTNSFISLKSHPTIHFFRRPKWHETSF